MIKLSKIVPVFLATAMVLWMGSCRSGQNIQSAKTNLADSYNPSRSSLHPDFSIHHINDSNTVVYLRIFPAELLFNQANEKGELMATMKISWVVFEVDDDNRFQAVTDSASLVKTIKKQKTRTSYFSAIPFKAKAQHKYLARIDIEDELRNSVSRNYLVIDKRNPFNEQNFRILSTKTRYPLFARNFAPGKEFLLRYNRMGFDSLFIDYYTLDRTLPRPIFSTAPDIPVQSNPDSSWVLPLSDTSTYKLNQLGIYKFKVSKDFDDGLSLFCFGDDFPKVQSPDDLLSPLVYLTSSTEFRDLRMEPNRKLAVDNFWLGINEEPDNARELIRVFYSRVLFSNLYFSSYKEGWKTDRGMVYIIFGPPDRMEKNPDLEKWIYFRGKSNAPLEFSFRRKENRFSYNNYELDRRSSSTSLWNQAVATWKKGKIYSPEL